MIRVAAFQDGSVGIQGCRVIYTGPNFKMKDKLESVYFLDLDNNYLCEVQGFKVTSVPKKVNLVNR